MVWWLVTGVAAGLLGLTWVGFTMLRHLNTALSR